MELDPEGVYAAFTKSTGLTSRDVLPVLNWFTLGIVHSVWRNSPIEDVHAGRGNLSDGAMFQINTWLTHTLRGAVTTWLNNHSLDNIADVDGKDFRELLTTMHRILTDRGQVLPHGETLAETAGSHLNALQLDISAKIRGMELVAKDLTPAPVIYLHAFAGLTLVRSWWGAPDWPIIVDQFIALLDDPDASHWHGSYERLVPNPDEALDRVKLAETLKTAPWTLHGQTCEWLTQAGIGYLRVDHLP